MDWVAELSGLGGRRASSLRRSEPKSDREREGEKQRGEEGGGGTLSGLLLLLHPINYYKRRRRREREREREGTERVDGEEGTSSASPPHHIEMYITNILR